MADRGGADFAGASAATTTAIAASKFVTKLFVGLFFQFVAGNSRV
jgi:hypothetical protein